MLRARGFTVVELLVVVAIVAVGASLAVPGVAQMIANRKVQTVAESIVNGLNLARTEAVRRNTAVNFTLRGDGLGWTVAQVSSGTTLQSFSDPAWNGVSIASTGSADTATFLATGLRQTGGSQLSELTVASNVHDSRIRRINLFGGGLIRMCDPAIGAADDPRRC